MQCTPWHSFSQFDGRESTLPVITISSIGIELERALNSRCAVIEVLQYIRREVPTIRASQQHHPEPPWVWLERPSRQNQGHQKVFQTPNRYLPTLTPRYQADPHGILTYSYCTLPASKIYCTITSQIWTIKINKEGGKDLVRAGSETVVLSRKVKKVQECKPLLFYPRQVCEFQNHQLPQPYRTQIVLVLFQIGETTSSPL